MHRVKEVHGQGDELQTYQQAIQDAAEFVNKYGQAYLDARELAGFLSSISLRLPGDGAIAAFRQNWQAALSQATITDKQTWKGIQNDKAAAEVELHQILNNWRDDARAQAQGALDELPQLVAKYGIVAEDEAKLHYVVVQLQAFIEELDKTTENSYLASAHERSQRYVKELQAEIEKRTSPKPSSGKSSSIVTLHLSAYVPDGRLTDVADWEKLDSAVRQALEDGRQVEIRS